MSNPPDAIVIILGEAQRTEHWTPYARYLDQRERGLRAESLVTLDGFLEESSRWTFEHRLAFSRWTCEWLERYPETKDKVAPHPLLTRLLLPTLDEWIRVDPEQSHPHRWLGLFFGEHLRKRSSYVAREDDPVRIHLTAAIALNPAEQPARIRLLELALDHLQFAEHHLPDDYLLDPGHARATIDEGRALLEGVEDADTRQAAEAKIAESEQLLGDYLEFQRSGGDDFAAWCASRERSYPWSRNYFFRR